MRFAIFLLWLLHHLPLSVLNLFAWPIGKLAYLLAKERRQVGLINLRLCFPDWSETKRRDIIRQHFHAMARMLLEYGIMWYATPQRLQRLVKIHNLDYLKQYGKENVIILYPHFVGFEMCVYRLNLEKALVSVYSNQKNPILNQQIYQGRMRFDNAKIVSRQEGLRSIIKAMKDHTPFVYLPDQDFGPKDSIFVPFFGVEAATITGLSRIAKLSKAKVIPAIPTRVGNHYELTFYPAWENFPTEDITADTRRMNAFIEERILEQPEQYFWLHKRFKTRPEGQARFYN